MAGPIRNRSGFVIPSRPTSCGRGPVKRPQRVSDIRPNVARPVEADCSPQTARPRPLDPARACPGATNAQEDQGRIAPLQRSLLAI